MASRLAKRLLDAGKLMRDAQKRYYATRDRHDLRIARDREQTFDNLVIQCETNAIQTTAVQGSLFPDNHQQRRMSEYE